MKKFRTLLTSLIVLLCSLTTSAHDFEVDGIFYNITSSSKLTVSVTYQGSSYNSAVYSGSVVIPEKVTYDSKEYSVTSIGSSAFRGCSGLTSVTIPNSVTSIGNLAFNGCSGLTSVTIPNSVTSIGYQAFNVCSGLTSVHITDLSAWCKIKFDWGSSNPTCYAHHLYLNGEEITNLVIPNDITSIGDWTFSGCSGLTSVTIPNSVTSIGDEAFEGCWGLTSVTIPNSVTCIGDRAFSYCSGLTSIYIPESVTRISQEAFYGCSRITRIDCMAATPPLVYNKTFSSSIYSKAIIYVPLESIDLYKSADYWKEFTTIRYSGYVEVKSISFDKATVEIEEGDTMNLAVTISPEDATDKTISWKSSDETIATVNDGVVTALKAGKATITAKAGEVSATCELTVNAKVIPATGITLDKTTDELTEGETLSLTATVSPENATDKTITWTSSDESIAKVSETGVVTALKAGKVTITASSKVCPTVTATCEITVNTKISAITLNKAAAEIVEGESLVLTATVSPEDATDKSVTWISSDESIAKISENGVVTALKAGRAIITASSKVCPTVTATCEITVNTKISAITLNKAAAEIVEGESLVLTATVSPEDATDKTVTWKSSDESIAKISENGVVTALKAGRAIITASSKVCPTVTATCEVVVKAKTVTVTGITLDKTTAEITEGETLTLTATVSPENATDKTVTWISSDESIAKVINGIVIGVKAGKATIIASCGDKVATCEITVNAKVIPTTGITLDKTTAEMIEGETLTLTATVTPENATDKTVVWTSSDETVATVANGVVTALKAGKATITAKAGEVSATCEITVNAKIIPATGITLDKTTAEMTEGETLTLTAIVTPEDATDKTVTWTSSDETVATVANGIVTALKAGKATITAKAGEVSATCEITVNAKVIPATGITLDKTTAELTEGETLTLTATVSPEDATDKTVAWTSSDETVATVNNGVVTALKAGKATITAKAGEVSATCEVTVNAKVIPATGITLDKTAAELTEGETLTLTATVSPEDATDKTVVWTSSDETVATVANGVVTALKAGKVTITAKAGEVSATCDITVNAKVIPATVITLDKTTAELTEGETLTLTATVTPEDATDKTVVWTSSDETVATVANGVVTALKAGKAAITAKVGEVSATCEITVNAKVIPATGITLDKTTAELTEGETLTLTATVSPEDATDKTVVWTSSDETVATVANGVVTALKAGKVTITAKAGEVSATCELTVNAKVIPATGIALDKTTAELTEGETLTLTATVTPENATDKTVVWTSSDETVATVANGVVTALNAGKATITAKSGEVSATCEITVNAKVIPATGITLDKTTAELTEGETLTLTATVSPEDATDKTVVWTSSDETVATVKDGVVTALNAGKATITAKSGEVSATCEITVNAKVIPATGITLDKTIAELTEGETLTLTATVSPEDATDKTVVWTSSDETVATVANGVVTALKAGKVTITAKSGEVSATCELTVNAKVIPAAGITLDKTSAELTEGETLSLTATVTPENATDKTVTWASSDEAVVKVVNGVVSALKTGKATITATSGDVSATCEITVIPVTGINGVICSDGYAAGNVYTVAGNLVCRKGEKLSNLPKGLYIVDGKKIVVK